MAYKIVITVDAEEDLDSYIRYLLFVKKNEQAARNLIDDFESTKGNLEQSAGALNLCENPRLRALGYRRINFMSHRYFMLYRIEDDTVYVGTIYLDLQDFESTIT